MFELKKSFLIFSFTTVLFLKIINNLFALTLNLENVLTTNKGFLNPIKMAVDDRQNNIYVVDYLGNSIFKITNNFIEVQKILDIYKPLSVVYYNNKLYITTEKSGVEIYNLNNNQKEASFGKSYLGVDSFKNLVKPVLISVDKSSETLFILDAYDNYIKPYKLSGLFDDNIGLIGGKANIENVNDGLFFQPTSFFFFNDKIFVGDTGNYTPYQQITQKWNPFKRKYDINSKYYGNPKGKIQIFSSFGTKYTCNSENINSLQIGLHGSPITQGYLYSVTSLFVDENYLYILDGINRKIVVFDNPILFKSSIKNEATLPKQNYPLAKPSGKEVLDIDNDPEDKVFFVRLQGVFDFGVYENSLLMPTDILKVNNYILVSDFYGRIFIFKIIY